MFYFFKFIIVITSYIIYLFLNNVQILKLMKHFFLFSLLFKTVKTNGL